MPDRFTDLIKVTLGESMAQFERQFCAHRQYQSRAYWQSMLGGTIKNLKLKAEGLTPEEVSTELIREIIGLVVMVGALSDFYLDRFGEGISSDDGS